MIKMNFTNNQTAFEYAMYMMLGSYFNKTSCKNNLLEKKMRLHYWEQKEKNQIALERLCIRFIEKELMPQLPKDIGKQDVEVKFCPTKFKGYQDIQFHGPDYILRIRGIYRGKNTVIQHQLWHKAATVPMEFQLLNFDEKESTELHIEKRGA